MSGSSTLRLCFAAMAPALTEAASARLKLQEPGTKHCDNKTVQPDFDIAKVDRLQSPRKNGDHEPFNFSGLKKSDDIADLTSRTPSDTVRSLVRGEGGGLVLTSGLPKHAPSTGSIGYTGFTVGGRHFSSLVVGEEIKTASLLNGLRRMNQPHYPKDQLELSNNHFTISSNSSADKLRILASKVSKSGMVNGENGLNDSQEDEPSVKINCKESGDAPKRNYRKAIPGQGNEVNIKSSTSTPKGNTMGMCPKNKVVFSTDLKTDTMASVIPNSEKPCEEVRRECVKKQAYLERKLEMLSRRVKRMKGKVVESHTKDQLAQYVGFQHRNLQMVAKSIKSEAPCAEVLKEHFLSNEDVKNMSTSQLVKLVRDNQSKKSLAITDSSPTRIRMVNTSAIVMSPSLQVQSFSATEKLSLRVQATENDLDSDATASSSGGESADEDCESLPQDVILPPLIKRADWKWAVDRAAIVSKWTWLQAQVSDLEYKIRQQSQVHRQLRSSKGGVVLGEPPTPMDILRKFQGTKTEQEVTAKDSQQTCGTDGSSGSEVSPYNVSALMSNVDKQATRLTQSLNCLSPASSTLGSPGVSKLSSPLVNGVGDSPSSSSVSSELAETTADNSPIITSASLSSISQQLSHTELHSPSPAADATCHAARCRPLRSYRKRKILRTMDLYKTNVKAARLSDVRCRCGPPANPCAMCGGRYNNTLQMDADNMSFNERVALLDPSFHPILSFPQDIPLSIHCEGVLKSGRWQNKSQTKRSRTSDCRKQKPFSFVPEPTRKAQGNKVQNSRSNNSTPSSINVSTKIKHKYDGKTKAKNAIARTKPLNQKANNVKKKAAKIAKALKRNQEEDEALERLYLEQEGSGASSSAHSALKDSHSGGHRRRRAADNNAFDINNIEIPHSIAASTRVEQIQYKEIVTPKWRVIEESSVSAEVPGGVSAAVSLAGSSVGKQLEKTNGVSVSLPVPVPVSVSVEQQDSEPSSAEQEEEVEDLSDEAYLNRHLKPEQEEMKRFRSFLQYPPVRRNRARSDAFLSLSDKENLSSTTPCTPTKPAGSSDCPIGEADQAGSKDGEGKPIISAMLNKSLPASMFVSGGEDSMDHVYTGRRRTISAVKRERTTSSGLSDQHALSFDAKTFEPWQGRVFPLSDEEYNRMLTELSCSLNCEPLHPKMDRRLAEPSGKVYVGDRGDGTVSLQGSRAPSPQPSNESLSSVGDDPTDPDWLANLVESKSKHSDGHTEFTNDPDWNGSPRKGKKR